MFFQISLWILTRVLEFSMVAITFFICSQCILNQWLWFINSYMGWSPYQPSFFPASSVYWENSQKKGKLHPSTSSIQGYNKRTKQQCWFISIQIFFNRNRFQQTRMTKEKCSSMSCTFTEKDLNFVLNCWYRQKHMITCPIVICWRNQQEKKNIFIIILWIEDLVHWLQNLGLLIEATTVE